MEARDMNAQPESGRRFSPTARNPVTEARFKRQSWWQITFPVVAVTILLLGCVVGLFFMAGAPGVSVIADYSVILLSFPAVIIGLVVLVVTVALTYLVMVLLRRIPPYTFVAHRYFDSVHNKVASLMDKITGAVIGFLSILSGISLFLKRFSEEQTARSTKPTEPGSGLD
jgi:hypothetical protein